ncbi:hypothetical protein R84B8_02096 [Treponema sp. R8-4-B8]
MNAIFKKPYPFSVFKRHDRPSFLVSFKDAAGIRIKTNVIIIRKILYEQHQRGVKNYIGIIPRECRLKLCHSIYSSVRVSRYTMMVYNA